VVVSGEQAPDAGSADAMAAGLPVVCSRGSEGGCLRFEAHAQSEHLFGFVRRNGTHDVAAVRKRADQAVLLESCQGFAKGNLADAELCRQCSLSHGSLRPDLTREYAVANGAVYLVGNGANFDFQTASLYNPAARGMLTA